MLETRQKKWRSFRGYLEVKIKVASIQK